MSFLQNLSRRAKFKYLKMNIRVEPRELFVSTIAPSSKSESLRALLMAALSKSRVEIDNLSVCDDAKALLGILLKGGCKIDFTSGVTTIDSRHFTLPKVINCGESAFLARVFTAIAYIYQSQILLEGKGTLTNRKLPDIFEFLDQAKVEYSSNKPYLPIDITFSPPIPEQIEFSSSESSQLLSGLIIANAFARIINKFTIKSIVSSAYSDLTITMLNAFGCNIIGSNNEIRFLHASEVYSKQITINRDWSGAAFWLVSGAISGTAKISGLALDSLQPDKAILNVLKQAGANINIDESVVEVSKSQLKAFNFDLCGCPDLFPPLVVLAINSSGVSRISGVHRLKNKESNRLEVLVAEFNKLGGNLIIDGDILLVEGGYLEGGDSDAHNDHRNAMALAIAALNSRNGINIKGAESVGKSYPNFFGVMNQL